MPEADIATRERRPFWTVVAAVLWAAALGGLLVRAGIHPHRATSLTTYLDGGAAWNDSRDIYTDWRGFVYPPVIACFFGIFCHLPAALGAVLWRIITAGGLLAGMGALLRSGVFYRIPRGFHGLVFIGVLPLSIGNLDNAQANPLIVGLMMLAVAAMQWEAWSVCALAVAVATVFKVYPVALGMLLCLLRPRQLCWRIPVFLVVLGLLPFAVKDGHYVSGQYHAWLETRLADNRFEYPMKDAPLDLWYLMVRLGLCPVSERVYTVLQAVGGIAVAAVVVVQARRGVGMRDMLAAVFLLVSVWMLLLGPATENQTYVVLAPAACLVAIQSMKQGSAPIRVLAISAFVLLLAAVGRNSLMPHLKSPGYMAMQPVAALLLLGAILEDWKGLVPRQPKV